MTSDVSLAVATLEATLRRCEAEGVVLSPRCLVVLAVMILHGLPLTARRLSGLAEEAMDSAMSLSTASRTLCRLWRAGLIVRLDRRHGYVARPARALEMGLLLCEPCDEDDAFRYVTRGGLTPPEGG